jgi:transcriptional regulator with XRE-family HTH domain
MKLQDLQDQLRAHIRARIGRGEMTGRDLAREADFPQGHLSNFLNARRGLSLESMDRLLDTLGIGVLDLVDLKDIQRRAPPPHAVKDVEIVAVVAAQNAALAQFAPEQILETRSFSRSFLRRLRPQYAEERGDWLRFVLIKLDVKTVRPFPLGSSMATVLIDRHYCSLHPYRRFQPNVYAVSFGERFVLGYVSMFEGYLVVRPTDPQQEVDMLRIERGRKYSEYIVGRICHLELEV